MSYQLGIDFGTTFTAAAVRRTDGTGEPEVVSLGGRGGAVSSVLHLARDERVTVGEAAAGLAGIDPTRVVRALKRRVGDPEPVVLGGHAWTAEDLSARLLRWVVDRVVEQEGAPPGRIALAHPPSWAAHTLERLAAALAGQDLGVTFVAEPRAVAHAAAGATAPGDAIAIHDLGGGRFDAAVLRREGPPSGGFAMLGVPATIGDLGGLDLDELVWQHVRAGLGDDVPPVARVRRACTRAKETLSAEDEVVVRVRRDEFRGAVRLDRATFEGLIAPHVDRTAAALRRTIASAGLEPGQLAALLLVGGSARIPLVARTVTEQLGCVPVVDAAPDLVARGAVLALSAPGATVDSGALVSTASGYLAVRTGVGAADPAEPAAPDAAVPDAAVPDAGTPDAAVPDATAPDTATLDTAALDTAALDTAALDTAALDTATLDTATLDTATLDTATPDAWASDAAAPVPADVPGPAEPGLATPPADVRRPAPERPEPAAASRAPVPTPRRSAGRRAAAVLDPTTRAGRRSLARTLIGVGAVIVAALVLVALFRPDGPLDPPLDPVAGNGASPTAGPAGAPPAGAPVPPAENRTDLKADPATVAVRPAAGLPVDPRPSVTTTPPVAPRARPVAVPPPSGSVRAGATAMTPTPTAPVV